MSSFVTRDGTMTGMRDRRLRGLGLAPLTARSIVLSSLMGSHPPRLPARALVVVGAHFGIAEGTVRTTLSRMVAAGELEADDSEYLLARRFRERQAVQDVALHAPAEPWDGTWRFVIVDAPRRSTAERRAFRSLMVEHRMGELRPETWLRPANIAGPSSVDGALVVRGTIDGRSPKDLAAHLWSLGDLAATGRKLVRVAGDACGWLETGDPHVLADTIFVSIATARFLRTEPQLPQAIVGNKWPPDELRVIYERLQRGHDELMRAFLTSAVAS